MTKNKFIMHLTKVRRNLYIEATCKLAHRKNTREPIVNSEHELNESENIESSVGDRGGREGVGCEREVRRKIMGK